MQCLTERTNPKSRKGYIAAATAEGKATLLTRAFGRGISFEISTSHFQLLLHWDQIYIMS